MGLIQQVIMPRRFAPAISGFHPSPTGSVVAALVIYRMLFGESVLELPSRLTPTSPGLPNIDLGDSLAPTVYQAVEDAVALWGRS